MGSYEVRSNIGIIFIYHPPGNFVNAATCQRIISYLKDLENNSTVKAVVLCGKGSTFSVGFNIEEFKKVDTNGPSNLSITRQFIKVADALENCTKPVIAACHGYALGGGLALALGCHYRVALSNAEFGFPEVKLGLVPSAGGTLRLSRLIGLEAAFQWIAFGKRHSAEDAAAVGLVDRIFPERHDIVDCAVEFARGIADNSLHNRRTSKLPVKGSAQVENLLAKYMAKIEAKSQGEIAPRTCLQTTSIAANLSFEDGLTKEEDTFNLLVSSGQSRALRYAFFAEKIATKWEGSASVAPMKVNKVAVIGLGTMGSGIAISLSTLGIPLYVLESDEKRLKTAVSSILGTIQRMRMRNEMSEEQSNSMQSSIIPTSKYSDLKDVDLVIEAVFESMALKKDIFKELDKFCKPSTILATNTSALDIDAIARVTQRPKQVVGMHFFAPAHRMKLLENVRGSLASPTTVATAMEMGKRLKKVTVLVGNCQGFAANRMYHHYIKVSDFLLEEGAYPDQVDAALRQFGFVMGRYQVADLSGIDVQSKVQRETNGGPKLGSQVLTWKGSRYCPLTDILCDRGRHGLKTNGRGWFRHVNGRPRVDPEVTDIIDAHRKRHNILPRKIQSEEILERMLYCMINEGFKILEDGIAAHPSVLDTIWMNGYTWPRHTGGPMYYANTIGLPRVLEVIEREWANSGFKEERWRPSSMLINLVARHGNPNIMDWMDLHKSSNARSSL